MDQIGDETEEKQKSIDEKQKSIDEKQKSIDEKQKSIDDINGIKEAFKEHQIPSFFFFGGTSVLGIGLFFVGPWAILLGLAFLLPSILVILNAILCMNPTGVRVYIAKICRNTAWILFGALLIAFGLVSCVGYLSFACVAFGALSVLRGILKAMIGSTTDVINTQRHIVELSTLSFETSDLINDQRSLVESRTMNFESRKKLGIVTLAESSLQEGGVYDLESKDYAGKRRKFLLYMIFSIFTSVVTGILVVVLSLPLIITLTLCGIAVVNVVLSMLRIYFF